MSSRKRACAGFTLFEILTVLAIFSVISVISTAIWFQVMDSWSIIDARTTLDKNAQTAFDTMREDFGMLVSPSLSGIPIRGAARTDEKSEKMPGMIEQIQRTPDDIVILPVERLGASGHLESAEVTYEIERGGEGLSRLLRIARPVGNPAAPGARIKVMDGVTGLRFQYFDGKEWRDGWEQIDPPKAVRVSLTVMIPRDEARPKVMNEAVTRVTEFAVNVS